MLWKIGRWTISDLTLPSCVQIVWSNIALLRMYGALRLALSRSFASELEYYKICSLVIIKLLDQINQEHPAVIERS